VRVVARPLVLAIAISTLEGCGAQRAVDDRLTRIRVAYTSAVDIGDLPSLIAHGSLEKLGYRVEPTFFAQPELAVQALASGEADMANGGTRGFWAAASKGADIVMVMEHSENGYQIAAVSGIRRCEDLDGRTLALSSRGSQPTALAEAYLSRCPSATPRVLNLPHSGDRLAALAAGGVDAAVIQRADLARLNENAPGRFATLDGFNADVAGLDFAGVFVTRRFAEAHRRVVVDYLRERLRAHQSVFVHPDLLLAEARRWPTMAAFDERIVKTEIEAPAWTKDGGVSLASARATLAFFVKAGSLPPTLNPDDLVDVSYVEEARATDRGRGEDH
jgi:ABC-type nitrate/sulfonate/bicarbonate transport system substrate-binding protein